ncbi:ArsR/SmtB family transcription factor [Arvimicrobium flavum]|uniref:ArsR/SmtB family transcription factor n=1 Tax=Arvimicrobium flavum TaxID=3393320 RepID=UPI00237AF47A|nr:metalloregulator ArsR/SmtB family transcription factor [Mesorhizobium shangrilense]
MFQALSDPHRRGMVERLSRGPASVKELAGPIHLALPSALKHLKVLEEGGIVLSEKVGRVRTYRMQQDALRLIGDWVRQRETALNQAFDRLAQAMAELPEEEGQ